jgi:hypothetical protein
VVYAAYPDAADERFSEPGYSALEVREEPTGVGMVAFTAREFAGAVLLEWQTAFEVDTLGFHIWREADGRRARVTSEMVPAALWRRNPSAIGAGGTYSWRAEPANTGRMPGLPVRYWLEEITLDGRHLLHGPVEPVRMR